MFGLAVFYRLVPSLLCCCLGSHALPVSVTQAAPLPTGGLTFGLIWVYNGSE